MTNLNISIVHSIFLFHQIFIQLPYLMHWVSIFKPVDCSNAEYSAEPSLNFKKVLVRPCRRFTRDKLTDFQMPFPLLAIQSNWFEPLTIWLQKSTFRSMHIFRHFEMEFTPTFEPIFFSVTYCKNNFSVFAEDKWADVSQLYFTDPVIPSWTSVE